MWMKLRSKPVKVINNKKRSSSFNELVLNIKANNKDIFLVSYDCLTFLFKLYLLVSINQYTCINIRNSYSNNRLEIIVTID